TTGLMTVPHRRTIMKFIAVCVWIGCWLAAGAQAIEVDQIRARNAALEARLLEARAEQARAILAGENQNQTWRTKLIQLKGLVSDINIYATAHQAENYKLAIDASQQLVKELTVKYIKKVYPNARPDKPMEDPILENFVQIFKGL